MNEVYEFAKRELEAAIADWKIKTNAALDKEKEHQLAYGERVIELAKDKNYFDLTKTQDTIIRCDIVDLAVAVDKLNTEVEAASMSVHSTTELLKCLLVSDAVRKEIGFLGKGNTDDR